MNKKLIIFLAIGLIVLVGGVFLLVSGKKSAPAPVVQAPFEETVSIMKPEDIGLTLKSSADGKKVILEVEDTKDISGLDYELSYMAKGDIPRGVLGHIDVTNPGQKISQEITLGTCSDVCHYDEDVSDIKLILKVTKADGSLSQIEDSLEL
ncbi:MAG: hypothetical protein Q8P26_02345 [Candidatus Levybacteria bacterium]|nr:hypothetical protein [Candidatus Levybacteria bacterium]